jgi:hypothetical protein
MRTTPSDRLGRGCARVLMIFGDLVEIALKN